MRKPTVSADPANSGSDNENAGVESEEVSEEEDPSEELVEEDPEEDEVQEVYSHEEPVEDACGLNGENLRNQEVDEVSSCEDNPNEEDPSEEDPIEHVSHEEERDEVDSSPGKEECSEESCEEEPYEEDEQIKEETMKVPCEQVQDVEESDEELEEPFEEEEEEVEPIEQELEEEPDEEEESEEPDEEEESEDPEEDPEENQPGGGSPLTCSDVRNNDESSQSNSRAVNVPSGFQNPSNDKLASEKLTSVGNTGRKKHSRWDIKGTTEGPTEGSVSKTADDGKTEGSTGQRKKTRWSRWSYDDSQISVPSPAENPAVVAAYQEFLKLEAELLQTTNKLQSGVVDDRPESERSPSPPPIYNNLGIRINTREARLRSKLILQKQTIISELIRKNPAYQPPPDYKNTKYQKRIYVPTKQYPEYNFIGLILGPRGNTHKRMEKETGAKILLRGKGSKTFTGKGSIPDPSDYDDLHVLVEADTEYSLDIAVAMVQNLIVPVEDGFNVHKLAQLKELAEIKGELRGSYKGTYIKADPCDVCGDTAHPTASCPLTASASGGSSSNSHQANFFAEMGSFTKPPPLPVPVANSATAVSNQKNEIDYANLYVGCLPLYVDDAKLIGMFSPFGLISGAKVMRDKASGLTKGYGFVRYANHIDAAKAVAHMNGSTIDGRTLSVRVKGIPPPQVNHLPIYPTPPVVLPKLNPIPMTPWPGPPESRLIETVAPCTSSSYLPEAPLAPSFQAPVTTPHFYGGLIETVAPCSSSSYLPAAPLAPSFQAPMATTSLFSGDFTISDELAQFPGYLKSIDPPPPQARPPSSSLPPRQLHFGGYHMPPS